MENKTGDSFTSISGQLGLELLSGRTVLYGFYGDLKNVSQQEYLDFLIKTGEFLAGMTGGKLLADFSKMTNYNISLRALAVNHTSELILNKVPFLLVAIIKSRSAFENLATQTALNMAKPLSKKFLDGKMFDDRDLAMKWLAEYPVPEQYHIS